MGEYDALVETLRSGYYYWKKRLQESQGKLCMSLDDKGNPTVTHYTEDECRHEMAKCEAMMKVIKNQPHYEYEWNDVMDDWVEVIVEGVSSTYVEPEEVVEETAEDIEVEEVKVAERMLLNPRPNLSTDMIEWMNRPAYANGRWNQGYKD